MTKGFITLATGDERYFKLAFNLMRSYKLCSKAPLPFAILTDRNNQYTDEFDEVIIMEDAQSSYMDKLAVLINCPFDETIFIDADCLVYADLNQYWDLYDFRYPITCFGSAGPLNNREGWFNLSDIGEYKDSVKFIPNLHGGLIFIKKSEIVYKMYRLAVEINQNYHKYRFKYFQKPADEPILALCMAIFDSPPINEKTGREIIFYPATANFKADFLSRTNSCVKYGVPIKNGLLIHWQNNITRRAIYKIEATKVQMLYDRSVKKLGRDIEKNHTKLPKFQRCKLLAKSIIYHVKDFLLSTILFMKVNIYGAFNRNMQSFF